MGPVSTATRSGAVAAELAAGPTGSVAPPTNPTRPTPPGLGEEQPHGKGAKRGMETRSLGRNTKPRLAKRTTLASQRAKAKEREEAEQRAELAEGEGYTPVDITKVD